MSLSKIKVLPNWIDLNNFKTNCAVSEKSEKKLIREWQNKILLFVHRLSKERCPLFTGDDLV